MPLASEIRQLGARAFNELVRRIEVLKGSFPDDGLSLAEFEALALRDVPPDVVRIVVRSLHNRRVIFARRNRGEVRIFADRPADIAGIFEAAGAVDRMLSATVVHMRALTAALAAREAAKAAGDMVSARDARDRLDAHASRLVGIVRKHNAKGLDLAEVRRELWALFPGDAMRALAIYEPGLAREATSSLAFEPTKRVRIANGLSLSERAAALIHKACDAGLTRSMLAKSIKPRPRAGDLAEVLKGLVSSDRIEAHEVRVKGPKRVAMKYFAKGCDAT